MSQEVHRSPDQNDPALEKLRLLSPAAKDDYASFRASGDEAALKRLILAVLANHSPDKSLGGMQWKEGLSLIDDLGFDSLAIAETVFYFEDLFQISISNEEIVKVRMLGELFTFVRDKVLAG